MATKKAPAKVEAKKPATPAASPAPTETKPEGLHIIAMQVENVKKVSFARIRPKGNMIVIGGPNGSGKSSVLDSIDWTLCGLSNVPSQPIKAGQNSGKIQVDLGEFKITRTFRRGQNLQTGKSYISELKVEGKGIDFKTPQTVLDKLMQRISFDPLEFIRMKADKQFETLRSMVDVDLDAIEKAKKEAYDKRREVGRELDSADARLAAQPAPDPNLPAAPIDTAALTTKLQTAAEHNATVTAAQMRITKHQETANQTRIDAQKKRDEVEAMKQELVLLETMARQLDLAADDEVRYASEVVVPTPIDTAAVAAELQAAQVTNEAIRRREARVAIENEAATIREQWNALDATVKAKEQERADALAAAKLPLPGLKIGDGEVLYNKLPFEQASNAEQIRVSAALAIASSPKLRVMCIRDGSLLDDKSMEMLAEMCSTQNYQLWIERVDGSGPAAVVMADGEASGDDVEAVKQ